MKNETAILILPATRREALAHGFNAYFNGSACREGHVAPRLVSGGCMECVRIAQRTRYHYRLAARRASR